MTATRYASITLSGRVVACGNSIFKLLETTPNNLIGRCRGKSLFICIGFNFFQLLSVASPNRVVYVTMDWLPLKCMGLEYRVARNDVMGLHRYCTLSPVVKYCNCIMFSLKYKTTHKYTVTTHIFLYFFQKCCSLYITANTTECAYDMQQTNNMIYASTFNKKRKKNVK